jgi:hypothetical protein
MRKNGKPPIALSIRCSPDTFVRVSLFLNITLIFLSHFCQAVDPLDRWSWRSPLPTGDHIRAVAYGNELFALVGDNGAIATSPDGINWTTATKPNNGTNPDLHAIAFGNNQFLAVGEFGTLLSSSNGKDWLQRIAYMPLTLNGIAYGNGTFVAVGYAGQIIVSTDGFNWSPATSIVSQELNAIAYGNGLFTVVGAGGVILTSSDGYTWTQRPSGLTNTFTFKTITYGNGSFVAAGRTYVSPDILNTILTSTDSIHWTAHTSVATNSLYDTEIIGLGFGDGVFVAVGQTWPRHSPILTSADGINWITHESGIDNALSAVSFGNGRFVIVGDYGTIETSEEYSQWQLTTRYALPRESYSVITFGNNIFVGVAYERRSISISSDGDNWTTTQTYSDGYTSIDSISFANGLFIAVGGTLSGVAIYTSSDGIVWSFHTLNPKGGPSNPANVRIARPAYGNGTFVLIGDNLNNGYPILATSKDGTKWTEVSAGAITNSTSDLIFANGQFVAVGSRIVTSPDGINWTERISTATCRMSSIAYGNGRFVTAGTGNTFLDAAILTSKDGIDWVRYGVTNVWGTHLWPGSVSYGNGQFMLSGAWIHSSPDGVNWTQRYYTSEWYGGYVLFAKGRYLMCDGPLMLASDPTPILPPKIISVSKSQAALIGGNMSLSAIVDGAEPLTYQWKKNGENIPGATGSILSLNSLAISDSGGYSVVVSNEGGTSTSSVAWISVYLTASTPQPVLPVATATTQSPPPALIEAPRKPSSAQMVIFNAGGLMDPSKMTIVLTHGWTGKSSDWPKDMSDALMGQGFDATANIVAWDWRDNANKTWPWTAAARAPSEGEALGDTLLSTLGANYNKSIHFLGHSLGAIVNCRAADYIHGDAKNSPGKQPGSTLKFNPLNTHITLLDEAELVTAVNGIHSLLGSRLNPSTASDISPTLLSKVIPDHSAWIDNYVSEVGVLHLEAVNVLLWRNAALGFEDSHGYSHQWYNNSIIHPSGGPMGHRWSFERHSLANPPALATCFLQNANSDPLTLELTQLDSIAEAAIAYPSLQAYRGLTALGSSVSGLGNNVFRLYQDGIQYAGDFLANTVEMFTPLNGQPVYVGTANSTPAYYVQAPSSPAFQAAWDLQFTLQPSAAPNSPLQKQDEPRTANTDSSVYALIPVTFPPEAFGLSFEFRLVGASSNEYLTMGISNQNHLTLEANLVDDGVWTPSSVIETAEYAGQQVQLFFGLNGNGAPPNGKLSIRGIQFYTLPLPTLNVSAQNTNARIFWPIVAAGWRLETADRLTSSNRWETVTNVPSVGNYEISITNPVSDGVRFFRLRK